MIKTKNLDNLVLTVKDLEKTVKFYTTVLGMQKETFKGSHIFLKYGSQKINLHKYKNEVESKAKYVQPGSADLYFIIETPLSDATEYIKSLGIDIEEGIVPQTGANGIIESLYLRDPDKNLIELSNYII